MSQLLELYQFSLGATTWRQSSTVEVVQHNNQNWVPTPISNNGVELSDELARNALEISCDEQNPIAQLFAAGSPDGVLSVQVWRQYETGGPLLLIFSGRVLNARWVGGHVVNLRCEPLLTSLKRNGLRRRYGKLCPYILYSTECQATKRGEFCRVIAVAGNQVTVDAVDSRPYKGGQLATLEGVGRTIGSQTDRVLTLMSPMALTVGQQLVLYPGCAHTSESCQAVHNNLVNFGGQPIIPSDNPFDGRIF